MRFDSQQRFGNTVAALDDHATRTRAIVFPSRLGWMAVVWNGQSVVANTFGWASPADAFRHIDDLGDPSFPGEPELLEPPFFDSEIDSPLADVVERLRSFAAGEAVELDEIPIDVSGHTPFQRQVLNECRRIARGATRTYGQLAERCGRPRAARAVGNVMRTNRFPLIVPCHRVVASSGKLGGYSAPDGLTMKQRLLRQEGLGRLSEPTPP